MLLLSEKFSGRKTPCCSDGDCHTELIKREYEELQNPPQQLVDDLIKNDDSKVRNEFLKNTMTWNNHFQFGSVMAQKAPAEQLAGRPDTVKYNGIYLF